MECHADTRSRVAYTSKTKSLLASVNRSVNRNIRPLPDRIETWSIDPPEGDCDDYVMSKRSHLLRAGVPAGALRVAVVKTSEGEGHAILLVNTSKGQFALDNLRAGIVPRADTGYQFVTVATADPTKWAIY